MPASPSLSSDLPDRDAATVFLDNGAGLIKLARIPPSAHSSPDPLTVPNAIAKPSSSAIPPPPSAYGKSRRPAGHLVAGEIPSVRDVSAMSFRRPHDRGILTTFDLQRDIWTSAFSPDFGLTLSKPLPRLLLTEPLGVPLRVRRATDQLVFEHFSFPACAVVPSQRLAAAVTGSSAPINALVLDSGFSATTAVPIVAGRELPSAARRLSIGGKALTNLLKHTITFRSWNMSDEVAVINAIKERCCHVALDYSKALAAAKKSPPIRYVLPDPSRYSDPFGNVLHPKLPVDPHHQLLIMRNEPVAIPEALFNPSDIGLHQAGVPELIVQAIDACPASVRPDLYANILLTGGNCLFPGFRERVVHELRPLVSSDIDVSVSLSSDPIRSAFHGGVSALQHGSVPLNFVTKQRYHEVGSDALLRDLFGDDHAP